MLKLGLIFQIVNYADRFRKEKIKIVIRIRKDKLGGKIMIEFVELRTKTYRYLIDGGSENEKAKAPKSVSKKPLTLGNYKYCLEATQLDNEINYNEIN